MADSDKLKHLKLIQGVINRLATNSFLLKGWNVVLVSALFALAAKDANHTFVYLAYFPAFTFWALDGYFLWQERLFRALYERVRVLSADQIDFAMDTSVVAQHVPGWAETSFSKTLIAFHGTITVTIILVMILMIMR